MANTGLTNVTALAIDPATPTTLYAGIGNNGGVFKSTNGGGNWSAVNTGLNILRGPGFRNWDVSLFKNFRFTAVAVDLGPSGDAGFDLMSHHVAVNQLAVLLVMRHRMRTRSDDTHPALQHINELR